MLRPGGKLNGTAHLAAVGCLVAASAMGAYGCGDSRQDAPVSDSDTIIFGGDVITMNPAAPTAEAVWIKDGKIAAVGAAEEILANQTAATQLIDLEGGTLLPGFVEVHMHMMGSVQATYFSDVSPCLPDRYETRPACTTTIVDALEGLPKTGDPLWIIGNGLDPSRMTLGGSSGGNASDFHDNPAKFIDEHVASDKPVLIIDQSGHLAYANLQAFVSAGFCASTTQCPDASTKVPESPAKWDVGSDGNFTGLLEEAEAFSPFFPTMTQENWFNVVFVDPSALAQASQSDVEDIARVGVTTLMNGGAMSLNEIQYVRLLSEATFWDQPVMRYRTSYRTDVAQGQTKTEIWDDADDGLFGAYGVKLWADGSTQGCTASLQKAYDADGQCSTAGTGKPDWTKDEMVSNIKPYWDDDWLIHVHANGDAAQRTIIEAFAEMQQGHANPNPVTLIHFTVAGDQDPDSGADPDLVKTVADLRAGDYKTSSGETTPPLDVRVSHLIAHVAYWGGAFENILDGVSDPATYPPGRVPMLDPTKSELEAGVPFSLHSDHPVSPIAPLWYVEQAVTRNTWFYPNLTDADVKTLPGDQGISVQDALRAVTIEPAAQLMLDDYIGSIEVGKVADLVILDKNPLTVDPNSIHSIKVLRTFVNGHGHTWIQ